MFIGLCLCLIVVIILLTKLYILLFKYIGLFVVLMIINIIFSERKYK
jgi:hypothetical protein